VPSGAPEGDPDCPFCEIVAREDRDVREVYRDAEVVAFFPTEPATLGHTLVIPRTHVRDIWGMTPDQAAVIARATLDVAHAIRRTISPDGLNVIQSNGEAATQSVMHLHVHVVPRWRDDRLGRIWPPETNYSDAAKDEAWGKLRVALGELST